MTLGVVARAPSSEPIAEQRFQDGDNATGSNFDGASRA